MSDLEVFGNLIDPTEVDDAVEATLKTWMATYLRRFERKKGIAPKGLPNPRSYTVTSDFDHYPEEALPAVLLITPGLLGRPQMDGSRTYRATFNVRVGVFVEAKDRRSTERLAKYYAAALRELLIHKGSLGSFAVATSWHSEDYGCHISDRTQRTIGTAELQFAVEVRNVVKRLSGPAAPIETEPGALPEVTKSPPVVIAPK